ncbi:hypothetical protein P7K49_000060 [Saguinus oedipus]|uniref:Uncharacterized protein n=1 Tax=Saguinus oedipus TaxID=9490 RepID=A0ABQ9WC91_SAGOE|nr:hypothetical protein P7K49_000060 [Saguinus oedipus]
MQPRDLELVPGTVCASRRSVSSSVRPKEKQLWLPKHFGESSEALEGRQDSRPRHTAGPLQVLFVTLFTQVRELNDHEPKPQTAWKLNGFFAGVGGHCKREPAAGPGARVKVLGRLHWSPSSLAGLLLQDFHRLQSLLDCNIPIRFHHLHQIPSSPTDPIRPIILIRPLNPHQTPSSPSDPIRPIIPNRSHQTHQIPSSPTDPIRPIRSHHLQQIPSSSSDPNIPIRPIIPIRSHHPHQIPSSPSDPIIPIRSHHPHQIPSSPSDPNIPIRSHHPHQIPSSPSDPNILIRSHYPH